MKYGKTIVTTAAVGLALALFAGTAFAEDKEVMEPRRGLFAGPEVGIAAFEDEDETEVAWGMNVWFRPINYAAFSIGYVELGTPESASPTSNNDEVNGFRATVMPMLPVAERLTLFGTFGVFISTEDNATRKDENVIYGGGVMVDFAYDLGMKLEYNRYDDNDSADAFTVGLFYRFGKLGK